MTRPLPPPALSRGGAALEPAARPPRCPRCGRGDLLTIAVGRQGAAAGRAAFCAGLYDRERRRIVMRSCGYSGGSDGEAVASPPPSA